jgi:hypothetical protein
MLSYLSAIRDAVQIADKGTNERAKADEFQADRYLWEKWVIRLGWHD